jgi:hypothetical protein
VSVPAVTARVYASDEVQYFSYLRSLYFDHDVSFDNEYRYFSGHGFATPGFHDTFLSDDRLTDAGRRVNYGTIGSALLWAPFYVIADVWTRATGAAPADGFSKPYLAAVAFGSALYAFAAVLLSLRAARTIVGRPGSLAAMLAVWVGTPLLFYMYVAPLFAHATSAFAVALFVNVWLHVRHEWSPRGTFVLGLCAGLLALVREQDIFIALGPAVDFVLTKRPRLAAAASGVVGTFIALVPQLLAYKALNGYFGPASHVSRKMHWHAPFAPGVFASPENGWIFWTPMVLLSLTGIGVLAWGRLKMTGQLKLAPAIEGGAGQAGAGSAEVGSGGAGFSRPSIRRIGLCLLIMIASQIYVAGSVESWTVAGAFGQRRFVGVTIVLVIGLTALWQVMDRRIVGVIVALCVWWNVALMAQFATRMMDRQRLELGRNAYNSFVRLPLELPALTYRYFTDRESFYERPTTNDR